VPVLCCPHVGDMAENSARVAWASVGLMLPWRLLAGGPLRSATWRLLGDSSFSQRAEEFANWSRENDGAGDGASFVEQLAVRNT
jgi:UDP:flavonoid glycosyltransferase YjiC (YdhE family)